MERFYPHPFQDISNKCLNNNLLITHVNKPISMTTEQTPSANKNCLHLEAFRETSYKLEILFSKENTQPQSDLVGFMWFLSLFLSLHTSCCVLPCCRGLTGAGLIQMMWLQEDAWGVSSSGDRDQYFQVFWNSEARSRQIIHKCNTLTANGTDSLPHPAQGGEVLFIMCLDDRESLTQWQLRGLES